LIDQDPLWSQTSGFADRKNKPSVTCFQQVLLISFEQEVHAPGVCTET
jgi:hypothetical protein